ncbi:MAG: hypothetical protein HWN80_07500, partial [Candidatus Lokiarchaeota archaeon]|nr:hypothetical protein [Candidatus Lokiarchaeota archaeon]
MLRSKWNRKIKAIFLLVLAFGMTFTSISSLFFTSSPFQVGFENNDNEKLENLTDVENQIPKISEYKEFDGSGDQFNMILHQSLINSSTVEFDNIDVVNSFSEPFPQYNGFNTSYINISIDNVYAPNYTYIVEDDPFEASTDLAPTYATSFIVNSSCYIINASFNLFIAFGTPTANVYLFNSTWVGSQSQPNSASAQIIGSIPSPLTGWNNLVLSKTLLNISLTDNNTWFIGLREGTGVNSLEWRYVQDITNGDNSYAYRVGVSLVQNDYECKVGLSPLNQNSLPSDIGLRINGTLVSDTTQGSGTWSSTTAYNSQTNALEFSLTSDWWDVSCNVTNVEINYTKTDLKATSSFNIPRSGQDVQWNVTVAGGLNYFDSRIANFNTINFTIPDMWKDTTIKVFNGTTEKTSLIKRVLGNGYREVQVLNAGNGTNWYLNANSTNLISSISTYVSGIYMTQVNFTNEIRFNATFGETISNGNLNLSVFSPTTPRYLNYSYLLDISTLTPNIEFDVSDWDISKNATDYGVFKVQISWNNNTAAGFLEIFFTVIADTDLILNSPLSGQSHYDNELFNVTVFYNDTGPNLGDNGITGAVITESSTLLGSPTPTGVDGYYSLELDTDDFNYGWNYIEITANKSFYNNQSLIFSFHHRINTTIEPSNTKLFGDVIRGDIVSYTFNYSDVLGNPILGATIQEVVLPGGFISNPYEVGGSPGNYTIELDTSNVLASVIPYTCVFNITVTGNQTQNLNLILTVIQAQTNVKINSFIPILNLKDGFDQQIEFFFNDTDNNQGVPGVPISNITVTDNQTYNPRMIGPLTPFGAVGNYRLNISISGLNSGWIQFELNVSRSPDYNWSVDYFEFYLRGNLTQTVIESVIDLNGEGLLVPTGLNYSIYIGRNINLNITIMDIDNGNKTVMGNANSYMVNYYQITNPLNQGILSNALTFDVYTNYYKGSIGTSTLTTVGTYAINITILKTDYEASIVSFNLTIKAKRTTNITIIEKPLKVKAGDSFNLILKAEYFNGTDWKPFSGVSVILTRNFDGVNDSSTATLITDINGTVNFEITIGSRDKIMILYVEIVSTFNYTGFIRTISDITVIVPPTLLEELFPYLIIGGIIIGAVGGSVGIYRGVVVPKKREKQRVLTQVKTIFDDAINLEHILVLYKGTGTCIFFKSYGSEQIDPELIGGFLSAVSSFGKEMATQAALNEISYGDKMLLLADGYLIRVALVLGKNASLILRRHLKEFITTFVKTYKDVLPNW